MQKKKKIQALQFIFYVAPSAHLLLSIRSQFACEILLIQKYLFCDILQVFNLSFFIVAYLLWFLLSYHLLKVELLIESKRIIQ